MFPEGHEAVVRLHNGFFPALILYILSAGWIGAATFGQEVAFLRAHTEIIVLANGRAEIALAPAWQGRVMTSTAGGETGPSFGWINRDLIAENKIQPLINVYGGEDHLWLGPQGGQFALFFASGSPFDLAHRTVPAAIDTEPFAVVHRGVDCIEFRREIKLTNYSGSAFDLEVTREVRLLELPLALATHGVMLPEGASAVAFVSANSIKNIGPQPWKRRTGLVSIWIVGMLNASPHATMVVPFEQGPETARGPIVTDTYFGKVPADRLVINRGVLFLRADARHRDKIGLSPRRAKNCLGSYDAANHVLTVVWYTKPAEAVEYVNSIWEIQKYPFDGDVINAYNDGPASPGAKQLGQYYELESSSPALALAPGESATHVHETFHFRGEEKALDKIARAALGVGVAEIGQAFDRAGP